MVVINAGSLVEEVAEKIWPAIQPTFNMIESGLLNELGVVQAWRDEDVEWLKRKVVTEKGYMYE